MRSALKFGIVGCGRIAQRHAEHIVNTGELSAVCDTNASKATALAEKYRAPAFENLEDMLEARPDLDVISVCTPNGLHAEHSIQALRAGMHVLCEKPMALSVKDCSSMIHTAELRKQEIIYCQAKPI